MSRGSIEHNARGVPLRERIADEICRNGPIPFSRYMKLCLYEPDLGYYSQARERFGKAGDFYTSSDVHAVFGRLLARQFEEMWRVLDEPKRIDLIELGPGRGLFARDVLDWSAKQFPAFARALRYLPVEQSTHLRESLHERLSEHISAGRATVYDSIEPAAFGAGQNVIVFGNEFFDALPVEIVDHRGALRVGVENGRFVESFATPSPAENEFLDRFGVHPEEGERVEAPLASLAWMDRISDVFRARRGVAVLIDYGYTREEQLAGRHRDTVMAYRQHKATASPYEAPGEQDITAHVNFTALQARGAARGLDALALLTQSQFLIGIGEETQFADAFQDCMLPQERAKVALQLKHLITPGGMGETFQVLLMSRGVEKEKAARLSGLKLAR
ncbi:MAG TPA: SAM-dependent methyltransferase [Terriglobales bacterium]|nr:SAM-dependent methyltransferase [Terriglobales bacterium]